MGLIKKNILGINITIDSKQKVLEEIQKYLFPSPIAHERGEKVKRTPLVIVTPNPEQIVAATGDKPFAQMLNRADVAVPDGIGIIWAGRILDKKNDATEQDTLTGRISGVDLMQDMVDMAAKQRVKIALIGGRGNLAVKALECLHRDHVGLLGWAEEMPELGISSSQQLEIKNGGPIEDLIGKTVRKIIETRTTMVFVGLGAPKQEYAVDMLKKYLIGAGVDHPVVLMVVGGSFDMIAGVTPRAPTWIRQSGLEWFWRLMKEPWRWKRQMALLRFIQLVFGERFFHT